VQSGNIEECDDGNNVNGDGCDMFCQREPGAAANCAQHNATTGSRCVICNDGFTVSSAGKCEANNCASLKSDGSCETCNAGYVLAANTCVAPASPVQTVRTQNATKKKERKWGNGEKREKEGRKGKAREG
jgi:cysteine-rich repeat protein